MLAVRLLGTFEITADGQIINVPSRPAQSLFAYLILNPAITHRREKLAGLFWPDSSEERSRASLRHELWRLRKALGPGSDCLLSDDLTVSFAPSSNFALDVRSLERLNEGSSIADLIDGLSGYRGELLPGFYDDWLVVEREHLQLLFEKNVAHLLDLLEAEKRWPEMVDWAERWIAMGQNPDAAYRALMLAYGGLGDRAKVLATYDRCVQALHALGLEPSSDLRALAEAKAPSARRPTLTATPNAPTGTVTFLFTDIEGSTLISQECGEAWEGLRQRHHAILQAAIEAHDGYVFQIVGDAFCAAFNQPGQAVLAAIRAQRDLQAEPWGKTPIRVRMGIHTGTADINEKIYRGYLTLSTAQRVMSAGHGQQVLLSQGACDLLEGDLPEGVGLRDMGQHRLKDLLKPQHLYQLVAEDLPSEFPPLKTLEVRPHNLPIQLTSFIGRQQEIHDLAELVRNNRLVTLTGVGGTGKTRLALQVAADVLQEFPDGVWLTQFASLSDPEVVPQAIAASLSLKEQPGRPYLDVLKDHLQNQRLLLILDNCEHLLDACAHAIDALLHAAPSVTILVTSREALKISGETTFHVHSLPLPLTTASSAETISQSDAVRLFAERALAAQPEFELTDQNAPIVSQVCARLDGIPLAIELAAARTRGMTIEQIAGRLDDRYRLLTDGGRTSLPRHRTLQAAIDWSHNLLDDKERILFRRLSVFRGGWTLEAATGVTAGADLTQTDVIELLPRLVEKSLITLDLSTGRYGILETIREYAGERLKEASEETQTQTHHLDHFLELAESADREAAYRQTPLIRLGKDQENILAAISWCEHAQGGVQKGLRLIGAVRYNWLYLEQHEVGARLARKFLVLPGADIRNEARSSALLTVAILGFFTGQAESVRWTAEEALEIARETGDQIREVGGLRWLGCINGAVGDHGQALEQLHESLRLATELGLPRALCAIRNDIGEILRADGDLAGARALYAENLAAYEDIDAPLDLFVCLLNLASVEVLAGNLARAKEFLIEGLRVLRESPYQDRDAAGTLEECALFLAAAGDCRHAAVVLGASQRQRLPTPLVDSLADQRLVDPFSEKIRKALGEEEFQAGFEEGQGLSKAEALAQATAWAAALDVGN